MKANNKNMTKNGGGVKFCWMELLRKAKNQKVIANIGGVGLYLNEFLWKLHFQEYAKMLWLLLYDFLPNPKTFVIKRLLLKSP